MFTRHLNPDLARRPFDGWAVAPLLALIGIVLAWDYLFATGGRPAESLQSARSRSPGDQLAETAGDRGRLAATPSDIPPRGWKDILLRVYANVSKHRIMELAAGMTYY